MHTIYRVIMKQIIRERIFKMYLREKLLWEHKMKLDKKYKIMFVQIFYSFLLLRSADVSRTTKVLFPSCRTWCSRQGSSIKKEFSRLALNDVTQFSRVSSFARVHAHPFPFASKQEERMAMIDCFFRAQFSSARSTSNVARHFASYFLFSAPFLLFCLLRFVHLSISFRMKCVREIFQ